MTHMAQTIANQQIHIITHTLAWTPYSHARVEHKFIRYLERITQTCNLMHNIVTSHLSFNQAHQLSNSKPISQSKAQIKS